MCPGPAANSIVSPTFTCVVALTTNTRQSWTLAPRRWLAIENARLTLQVKQSPLDHPSLISNWIQIQLPRAQTPELRFKTYRPSNTGLRFSTKAFTALRWSAVKPVWT